MLIGQLGYCFGALACILMPKTLMVSKAFLAVARPRTQWWVTSVSCPVAKAGVSPVGGKRFPGIESYGSTMVYNNPQKRIEKANPSKLVKNLKLFHFFVCFIYPAHDHFGQGKSSATPWQKNEKWFQYVSVCFSSCERLQIPTFRGPARLCANRRLLPVHECLEG